jgi:hypothetical protein
MQRRNSAGYGRWDFGIVNSFTPNGVWCPRNGATPVKGMPQIRRMAFLHGQPRLPDRSAIAILNLVVPFLTKARHRQFPSCHRRKRTVREANRKVMG